MANFCITGARGFIGRHLARTLAMSGHQVFGLGHGAWPDATAEGMSVWINGSIDAPNLSSLAERAGHFDAVFHLAGGSAVAPSLAYPHEDFERTVATSARLLEWLRQFAPETRLVATSSAAVYGDVGHARAAEGAPLAPTSPYGTHKLILETMIASYRRHFAVKGTAVRLFSVYGPGLEKQLLFELCCRCSIAPAGASLVLGGTGTEQRDWLHVSDAVALLILAARSDPPPGVLNGGTGIATPVSAIAKLVCGMWEKALLPTFSGICREGDPLSLVADPSRASAAGFAPGVAVDEGVRAYVDWFRRSRPR